jgi:hypothetical protein
MLNTTRSAGPGGAASKPRALVRLLAAILFVLFLAILTEAVFAGYLFLRDGRWVSPAQRWAAQENLFIGDLTSGTCRYVDSLFPHPYLVAVHTANPPCPTDFLNAQGLFGRDFPLRRDPETFTILLTGGSVAAHLGQVNRGGPLFLEEALNACYTPPKGRRFLVYNAADGGWRQPRQAIISLLYGDAADAIVTLDGFNEAQVLGVERLEMPEAVFELLNPLALRSGRGVAASMMSNQMQIFISQSLARYFLYGLLRRRLCTQMAGGDCIWRDRYAQDERHQPFRTSGGMDTRATLRVQHRPISKIFAHHRCDR